MEFASRWGRWGENPAVLVNLNGADASMSFTARIGAENRPGLVRAELASYDPDVEGPCRQALANTRSWAVLGADGAASLPQEACIDLIWTRSVHLLPGQPRAPVSDLANARREDLRLDENTPNLARDVKVCIRGTNGQALPVAGDWRREAPVAVAGRLLLEGHAPGIGPLPASRIAAPMKPVWLNAAGNTIRVSWAAMRSSAIRTGTVIGEVTAASCLSSCAPRPLRQRPPGLQPLISMTTCLELETQS